MSVLREHSKTIERRIGEEICRFANGACDCQGRERLCQRAEDKTSLIMRLAAQAQRNAGFTGEVRVVRNSIVIDMPADCDMIVVFADRHQHVPVWLGLPHQLYLGTAADLMRDHAADRLTIVPYRNADKVMITRSFLADAIKSNGDRP